MSLTFIILNSFSILAIAGLAYLLHKLGNTKNFEMESEAQAKDVFLAEFPDTQIDDVTLGATGQAALITLVGSPHLGLIHAVGSFACVKMILPKEIESFNIEQEKLVLKLTDYTDPIFKITFATDAERRVWSSFFVNGEMTSA